MDNRSAKLSELPAANAVGNSMSFYVVDNGVSMSVNAIVLAAYILTLIHG